MPPAVIASLAVIFGFLFGAFVVEAIWKIIESWLEERNREKLRWK